MAILRNHESQNLVNMYTKILSYTHYAEMLSEEHL